ncbi:hypothetical protein GGI12_001062 [Dipsacomyces acuminosporus]|nr:hypothetical protein GGI12_001062 [Dipsacomyces acuminosporus]
MADTNNSSGSGSNDSAARPLLERRSAAPLDAHYDGDSNSASDSKIAYVLFSGMGLGTLLPWNLFISASEFYQYQFAGSPHQQTFQNSYSVTYMVTNLAFTVYAMLTVTKVDPNKRIFYGLVTNTLVYIVGMLMPLMGSYRGSASFYIAITQLAVTAATSGLLTNSMFALVAHFPPSHSEAILSGQAVAGIIAALAQLVTAYSVPSASSIQAKSHLTKAAPGLDGGSGSSSSLITRTIAYFAFAAAANIALTVAFLYTKRNPYYAYRSKLAYPAGSQTQEDGRFEDNASYSSQLASPSAFSLDLDVFKTAFRQISGYTYVILLDFTVTLAVFPSVTALVTSTTGFKLLTEWHFFIFNLGDFLGRHFAPSIPISSVSSLLTISAVRFLFVPAFFLCHVTFSVWYNWITSDYIFLFLVVALGATNGYLSTRSAMTAPTLADNPTIAGSIVAISISTGLAIGSVFSWPVRAAGCLCSPF